MLLQPHGQHPYVSDTKKQKQSDCCIWSLLLLPSNYTCHSGFDCINSK